MESSRTKRLPDRTSASTDDDADAPIDRSYHLESRSNEDQFQQNTLMMSLDLILKSQQQK